MRLETEDLNLGEDMDSMFEMDSLEDLVDEPLSGELDDSEGEIDFDEEDFNIGEEEQDSQESIGADSDGAILPEDYDILRDTGTNDFISESGSIVVMEKTQSRDKFIIDYVPINNIAVMKRIRTSPPVESLIKSIKDTGLLKPLVVAPTATDGIYVLIDGYRRLIACAKTGIVDVPCVVNTRVNTTEIPILEALYNHHRSYSVKEMVDYIEYLEVQKSVMSSIMIEYLLQMEPGDYAKLKDVLNDGDENIVPKMMNGQISISDAFKALEKRRKKESVEEKDMKKAEAVYSDKEKSGADDLTGSGEEGSGAGLSEDEIQSLYVDVNKMDAELEDVSLDDMVEAGKDMPGFEAHKQKVGEREFIDPIIKKTVLARDGFTCVCCRMGGEIFVDALDFHHVLPVFLGGKDTVDNGVTACLTDHRLIHLYSTGDLHIPKDKSAEEIEAMTDEERVLYNEERMRLKRIVRLGQIIREGMAIKGIKREQYKKEHPIGSIGRNKPGRGQERG